MNRVSTLCWISDLIGQDRFQKVSSEGSIGIQERWPCGINYINRVRELDGNLLVPSQEPKNAGISYPICRTSADVRGFSRDKSRTPHESHNVVLDVRTAVPPNGYLDVSKQLADGQSNDFCVVVVLWCDGQRIRSQFVVEIGRARQSIRVVFEKGNDL